MSEPLGTKVDLREVFTAHYLETLHLNMNKTRIFHFADVTGGDTWIKVTPTGLKKLEGRVVRAPLTPLQMNEIIDRREKRLIDIVGKGKALDGV